MKIIFLYSLVALISGRVLSQGRALPFHESFDSTAVPGLPAGWLTSFNRSATGDFSGTTSTPFAGAGAALSTNATIPQFLLSPPLDFTDSKADSLIFFERRSSTHNAGMVVEISIDGGISFPYPAGDTLRNAGNTGYVLRALALPSAADNGSNVRIRWRVLGDGTGSAGTLRLDEVYVSAVAEKDLSVSRIFSLPENPVEDAPVTFWAVVRNSGSAAVDNFALIFYLDKTIDTSRSEEVIDSIFVEDMLGPGDSLVLQSSRHTLRPGETTIGARVRLYGDRNLSNDSSERVFLAGNRRESVCINEIMYDPASGGSEYVELLNRSPDSVDMRGWKLIDAQDSASLGHAPTISDETQRVEPGGYLLYASDSSVKAAFGYLNDPVYHICYKRSAFSLNNGGDNIVLLDPAGHVVDSLRYSPAWHNPLVEETHGKSLERILPDLPSNDARSWSTCADPSGGTPARKNSIFLNAQRRAGELTFTPNPFSPDGDGRDDFTLIDFVLEAATGLVRVQIFDASGRRVRLLADGEPAGSHSEFVWNGFDDRGVKVPMGIYVVLIEAVDSSSSAISTLKGAVVVAAKLH